MEIEKLIKKFRNGTITKEELITLMGSLKESEPHDDILEHYNKMWNSVNGYNAEIDSKDILRKISDEAGITNITVGRIHLIRSVFKYAAIFVLSFGLSWLIHTTLFSEKTDTVTIADQVMNIEVPYGSKSRIILPDSSIITLNSGSSLKYSSTDFNSGSRSVSFTGEGFFSISEDSTKPFYVNITGIKVKVLGTTFNIKAYPEENVLETTLISGKVEIYSIGDRYEKEKPIVLNPNQSAVFVKSGSGNLLVDTPVPVNSEAIPVQLKTVNLQPVSEVEQIISWKENMLVFDNEPFESLIIKIERWYDVKILNDNQELNSARFTGKFDNETIVQVLNSLVTVTPFHYTIKKNIINISQN